MKSKPTNSYTAIAIAFGFTTLPLVALAQTPPETKGKSQYAPGQQTGPAKDYAPGRQTGPAKEYAPGQQGRTTDPAGTNATSSSGVAGKGGGSGSGGGKK